MCDDTAYVMSIVRTVKSVEKKLNRELSYTDLQVIIKAARSSGQFELDFQPFAILESKP